MTTTIAPSSGAGALYTQQGVGTTPGFAALDIRRASNGALQEGVYGTATLVTAGGVSNVGQADFMVTQRGAGANMSVDINMPAGGFAYVQGDTIGGQGLYCVPVHSANINELIAAADATNPRVDQVILEIQDNVLDASGANLARVRVLTGTPGGTASLATRAGAAALPGSALLLADVLVPALATTIPNSGIRDRRKWARGAYVRIVRTAGSYTITTTTAGVVIDATNISPRVECSGAPVRAVLSGLVQDTTAATDLESGLNMDGATIDTTGAISQMNMTTANKAYPWMARYEAVPSAASHLFAPTMWGVAAHSTTLFATALNPLIFTLEEIPHANAANNTVTTG